MFRWINREKIGWDRIVELAFIGVVAFFAILQYCTVKSNNASTTNQVSQLITAANNIEQHQAQLVKDNKQVLLDNRNALDSSLKENRRELENVLRQNRDALQAQTVAANGQLAAVRQQTEVAERPWVSASIVPVDGVLGVGKAVTFNGDSVEMYFKFTMKNVGKSVALDVQPVGKLLTFKSGENPISESLVRQAQMCGKHKPPPDPRDPTPLVFSTYLFPGDTPKIFTLGVSVPYSELNTIRAPLDEGGESFLASPMFVGCVEYRFSFGGELRHQFFNFNLSSVPPPDHLGMTAAETLSMFQVEVGKNLTAPKVTLSPSGFGGNSID